MKKDLKVILMSGIASVVTATIIFISGGGIVIATLLGGTGFLTIPNFINQKNKRNNKNNTSYIYQIDDVKNSKQTIEELDLQTKEKQSITPIKQYDDLMVQELITIDALTQKEKVLVRTRKKETEEKFKENNNYKK